MKSMITALILALPALAIAQAQTVWRCGADGRSYSDVPCQQGQQLALADRRPAADVQSARERAAQEQRAADTLLRERLQREAAVRRMGVAADRPLALVKPDAKMAAKAAKAAKAVKATKATKAKGRSARPADAGIFRAVAPESRRKPG